MPAPILATKLYIPPLRPGVVPRLLERLRWQEHGMIFTTSIGTYIDQTRVSREFKALLQQAGLPDIRFHDLRHTSLSFLLDRGTPVNVVQKRASHSKVALLPTSMGIRWTVRMIAQPRT